MFEKSEITSFKPYRGSGVVGCSILRHQGIQLRLAFSWARPAILAAGKGRGGVFIFLRFFTFTCVPLSSLSFSFIYSTISGWPRTLENRENGEKKFPAGKNQGI